MARGGRESRAIECRQTARPATFMGNAMAIWSGRCNALSAGTGDPHLSPRASAQTDGERIWELHVTVFTRCARDVDISGTMTVTLSDTRLSWHSLIQGTNIEKILLNFTVSKNQVSTWWPRGYGGQLLYNLTATLEDGRGELVSRKSVRFGFRSVQLVQDPIKDMHPNNEAFQDRE
ncbi:MANBA-like protein [Mya arenaria]|uniref:MANBA-like protein n=1 Tax=Mya arenaria TaxID=6604 RepID=A0ABY7E3Q6_MYAAR|nr:MANBA-like protein [Mya arenaria]